MQDLIDRFVRWGELSNADAKLLIDWAAGGESCKKAVTNGLTAAGQAKDANKRRREIAKILNRAKFTTCFI
jgi:hypothetical protein